MRRTFLAIGALAVIALVIAAFLLIRRPAPATLPAAPVATTTPAALIGHSVQGRPIQAYVYGAGPTHLLFVGGMHGGYEWNSVLLAYDVMDYLSAHPDAVPGNLSVAIIPNVNPDGVFAEIGKEGRFSEADVPAAPDTAGTGRTNADNVDLNRNFNCRWAPTSTWQGKPESAGTAPFSEPEARALRDYIAAWKPVAVAFWHSASGTVYASECGHGVLPETLSVMNAYAKAAGYKTSAVFDAYSITGDSEGWLASLGIPAVTVELTSHNAIEFDKNLAGMEAMFALYPAASSTGAILSR